MGRPASISECLDFGMTRLKSNMVNHIIAAAAVVIIGGMTFILMGPMIVGYFRMIQKEAEGGEAGIEDVFSGFNDFVPALVAGIVGAVLVSIGLLLCIVPGLIMLPVAALALYHVAMGEKDGIHALKRAWHDVKEDLVSVALTAFVMQFIAGIGMILCYVGMFLTYPIGYGGLYRLCESIATSDA